MNTQFPVGFGYEPPQDVNKAKRQFLRSGANYAGLFMLVLVASFQLTFPIILLVLSAFGVVSGEALTDTYLGLGNTAYLVVYSVVYALAMGAPLLLLLGKRGFNPLSPRNPVRVGVGAFGFLGAVGTCMLANIITSFILALFSRFGVEAEPTPSLMENTPVSFLLNLFVLAVLPAFLEELVFRGCILRVLRPCGELYAIVISAVLFGLMHGNLRQIPFATIVGFVLGYLYVVTGNIWMPILVHFTNNAISVVSEYLSFSMTEEQSGSMYLTVIYLLILVGAAAVALLFGCFWRRLRLRKSGTGLSFGSRTLSLFTAPVLIGSVALFILIMIAEMYLNG